MNIPKQSINRTVWLICGAAFAAPAIFFSYYTVRLIYVNLAASAEDAAAHRTGGMLIGAITFPLAAIIFGLISWFCINKARRGPGQNRER
jgi:hypothetical protein